jgi:hypothetical protein
VNYRRTNSGKLKRAIAIIMLATVCATTTHAQMDIGDNLKLNLNGSTGFSYNGSFGNSSNSMHANGLLFDFTGNGYYFHPNFLSFNFHPYYNRTQTNSESQSIGRGSGVGASANFFGGSRFPGSITWGKDFGSNSNFQLAGVPTISSNSSGQTFGVSWSALLPKWPQVTASFSKGSSDSSFADLGDNSNSSTSLNLTASYQLAGWSLSSGMNHYSGSFSTPAYLTTTAYSGSSRGTSYSASTGHALPLRGNFSFGWGHSTTESTSGYEFGTTSYTASNSFNPIPRLNLFQNANYVTNLSGMLLQTYGNGVLLDPTKVDYNSYGVTYGTGASYFLGRGITVGGFYNRRYQELDDRSYSASQYGGNINFTHSARLFGMLNFGIGMADTAGVNGNNGGSINTNVGLSKRFGHWETSGDFGYAQNIMTLGTFSTTSSYNYGGSLRRRVNKELSFGGSYRSSHSGIVAQEGNGNVANSFTGQFQWKKYSLGGGYSQSNGSAVLTSGGVLVATPVGSLLSPELLLFNAKSYNVSASTRLFRRITVTGGYSQFTSETTSSVSGALNTGSHYNAMLQYRLRKFQFSGGFNRTQQATSTVVGGPRVLNSFYLSLSRWFNVF